MQSEPTGLVTDEERRSLRVVEPARRRKRRGLRHQGELGESACGQDRRADDPVTCGETGGARSQGGNLAAQFDAGGEG